MIFISHNSKDKKVTEPIAIRLAETYGVDNVFYDSWSIQPGDGIIDKMEEGLEKCQFFFFFVSDNSLKSNMVKLEWQNALMRKANNDIRFIPVRIDKSKMPFLLTQTLYIDLFTNGLENTIRQMADVIEGRNTYRRTTAFSNLQAYKTVNGNEIKIECRAEHYFEPIASFLFLSKDSLNDIEAEIEGETTQMIYPPQSILLSDGNTYQAILRKSSHGSVSPGFPFTVCFTGNVPFDIIGVMHEISRGEYKRIPLINLEI